MKFELKNAKKFELKGLKGWAYNSKDDFPNLSAVYIEVNGRHGKIRNIGEDRCYYVIEGEGIFTVNKKKINVKKTDVIIVPKDTEYDYEGKMTLLLVDSPAFDPSHDIKLE